jgi:HTH-type transcriptional regulator / antitoxin HipB
MTKQISPLRQRMIDDTTIRNMSPLTQYIYLRAVANFSTFHGRSPDKLGHEEAPMDVMLETPKQAGAAIHRIRRQRRMTQADFGAKTHVRQATISKLEHGKPNTQLRVLMDTLGTLDLELVIRPRSSVPTDRLEDLL